MYDTAGSRSHWYDKLYDVCNYSNGYSVPEAFYGSGKVMADGYRQQHKTFSYVDQRSGRTVRLYGIIDRYSPGADADFLISQIVSDILPFDRTTDHVLNNDPSDRQIYCLLDEALRKVYKVDLNSSSAFARSYRESDSRRSPASSGSRVDNNGILQMDGFPSGSLMNYPHRSPGLSVNRCENNGTVEVTGFPPGNYTKTNGVNLPNLAPMNPPITEAVAQRLSVMEFLNFYKDIIERVDQAANADERKYMEMARMNQVNPYIPVFNPPNEGYFPQAAPVQYSMGNSYIGIPPQDHYTHKSTRRRNYSGGRKFVARNTTLPTISESAEKWWNEESETLMYPEQQQQYREQEQNFEFPDNTVLPQAVPPTFQRAPPVLTPVESPRVGNDEEFLKAVEEIATDLGYIENSAFRENGETASVRSDDKYSNTDSDDSVSSCTAAAIVFIYGNKMFIGSIGDSRIILMRQKCHYLDVMYLNEPPLAWYPIAAAKNPHFKARRYILFQEPIVRGGFLINEYSIFLLMFNDGVITNMLNVNEYYRTSNEINRSAVQMVIKIIEKYPSSDIAEKFIAQIMHWCNRKYGPFQNLNGAKREGMSFLFADLRQLMPKQPDYGHLLRKYQGTLVSKAESYPKMVTFSQHLEDDEETMKHASSMNKVYDMLQEIFDREESERRAQENPLKDKTVDGETWVVVRNCMKGREQ